MTPNAVLATGVSSDHIQQFPSDFELELTSGAQAAYAAQFHSFPNLSSTRGLASLSSYNNASSTATLASISGYMANANSSTPQQLSGTNPAVPIPSSLNRGLPGLPTSSEYLGGSPAQTLAESAILSYFADVQV